MISIANPDSIVPQIKSLSLRATKKLKMQQWQVLSISSPFFFASFLLMLQFLQSHCLLHADDFVNNLNCLAAAKNEYKVLTHLGPGDQ